jgi:hypothetical protein
VAHTEIVQLDPLFAVVEVEFFGEQQRRRFELSRRNIGSILRGSFPTTWRAAEITCLRPFHLLQYACVRDDGGACIRP